jgi:hypothetical protein
MRSGRRDPEGSAEPAGAARRPARTAAGSRRCFRRGGPGPLWGALTRSSSLAALTIPGDTDRPESPIHRWGPGVSASGPTRRSGRHGVGGLDLPYPSCRPFPCLARLSPGKAHLPPMPAIAHMICQGCGTRSEGLVSSSGSPADRCQCGGVRQVVRIVRHASGATSPSLDELERSVQDRARDETLTRTRKEH